MTIRFRNARVEDADALAKLGEAFGLRYVSDDVTFLGKRL